MGEQRPVVMGMRIDESRGHHLARRPDHALRAGRRQGADFDPIATTPTSASNLALRYRR
jgi:hypothetical protein